MCMAPVRADVSSRRRIHFHGFGVARQGRWITVEKVVVGPVSSPEPHPNTWTSTPKHCNGRVFESLKDARNGPRGVFQQAAEFSEVPHSPRPYAAVLLM